MFKIRKASQRIGKFEDRWEPGCWVGSAVRTGEHLVATSRGAFRVSTVMRRPSGQCSSETIIQDITGSLEVPIPGMSGRCIPAHAKQYQQTQSEQAVHLHMQDPDGDPRKAKVHTIDVDEHGPTEQCPGCRAPVNGKYRRFHTDKCRRRFKRNMLQAEKRRRRFEAATERRLNAATKKAMQMHEIN